MNIQYLMILFFVSIFGVSCKRLDNANLAAITGAEDGTQKAFGILPVGAIGAHLPTRKVDFAIIECTGIPGFQPDQVIHKLEEFAAANLLSVNNGAICVPQSYGSPNMSEPMDRCTHPNFIEVSSCTFAKGGSPYGYSKVAAASQVVAKLVGASDQITREMLRAFVTAQAIYLSVRGPTLKARPWGQSMFIHSYARMSGVPADQILSKQDAQDFIYNPCDTREFSSLAPALQQQIRQYVPDTLISSSMKLAAFRCAPQSDNPEILHYAVGGSGSKIDQALLADVSSYSAVRDIVYHSVSGHAAATVSAGLALAGSYVEASNNSSSVLSGLPIAEKNITDNDVSGLQMKFSSDGKDLSQSYNGQTNNYTFGQSNGNVSTYKSANGSQMQVGVFNNGKEGKEKSDLIYAQAMNKDGYYSPDGSNLGMRIEQKGFGSDATTHVWGYYVKGADGKPVNLFAGKSFYATVEDSALGSQRALPERYHKEAVGLISDYARKQEDPAAVLKGAQIYSANDLNRDANDAARPNSITQAVYKPLQNDLDKFVNAAKAPPVPAKEGLETSLNFDINRNLMSKKVMGSQIEKLLIPEKTNAEASQPSSSKDAMENFRALEQQVNKVNLSNKTIDQFKEQEKFQNVPQSNFGYDNKLTVNPEALTPANRLVLNQVDKLVGDFKREDQTIPANMSTEEASRFVAERNRLKEIQINRDAGIAQIANAAMDPRRRLDGQQLAQLFPEAQEVTNKNLWKLKEEGKLNEMQFKAEIAAANKQFQALYTNLQQSRNIYRANESRQNMQELYPLFNDEMSGNFLGNGYIPFSGEQPRSNTQPPKQEPPKQEPPKPEPKKRGWFW